MTIQSNVTTVANEAIDQLECVREHLRWLSALGKAIHEDLASGRGFVAKDLASLVQYLADDHCYVVDDHISRANDQMNNLELRA
ncbi:MULTISPECIES: hypothetical protein [unclassified Pseudomonas]|uniref:hypothetical protein n=1 Tax=Pseudomonas sp. A2 TaxID=107445 RepID=UPI0018A884E2|nr:MULTISPECIES: hypothetical protein [unclassified Pseudomonas]MBF8792081.1 hypothetical protein [Pseudomonas monteilii]UPK84392.1 hypothetical protein E5221_05015 [Pseudomonas sp. A2]